MDERRQRETSQTKQRDANKAAGWTAAACTTATVTGEWRHEWSNVTSVAELMTGQSGDNEGVEGGDPTEQMREQPCGK